MTKSDAAFVRRMRAIGRELAVLQRKSRTTPMTGARCSCRPGIQRDNCSTCEGSGWVIDFAAIHAARETQKNS